MRKIIIGTTVIVAITLTIGLNFNQNRSERMLSSLVLSNVEALATGESGEDPCDTSPGSGCYNHAWFPHYTERYTW